MATRLSSLDVLHHLARQHPFRSLKALSDVAGINSGNFHASLSGRRALPAIGVRRLAAALGMRITASEDATSELQVVPGSLIHLELNINDLPASVEVLQAVLPAAPTWHLISKLWTDLPDVATPQEDQKGVYALAFGRVQQSYVVLHLRWPSLKDAIENTASYEKLRSTLGGTWATEDVLGQSVSDTAWIRLVSGLESVQSLDRFFAYPTKPDLRDWANMLVAVDNAGLTPKAVLAMVSTQPNHER